MSSAAGNGTNQNAVAPPLRGVVLVDPERLGGVPVFAGTRVPVKNLFDAIRAGQSIGTFLDAFPGVTRAQVEAVLSAAEHDVFQSARAA